MGDAFLIGQGKAGGASTADKIKLTQDTADLYGLTGDDANVDVALARGRKWQLLQEYKIAGTYSWTAPDLFNGEDYEIGVWMCGGGGGGGCLKIGTSTACLVGGSSGVGDNIIFKVSPGDVIPVVVGSGGVGNGASNQSTGLGGSTSFFGKIVRGGSGGRYSSNYDLTGGYGGQVSMSPSINPLDYSVTFDAKTPAYGVLPPISNTSEFVGASINGCYNFFEGIKMLAAGGSFCGYNTFYRAQEAIVLEDGGMSSGFVMSTNSVPMSAPTSPGCGGGSQGYTGSVNGSGADGADGAVFIYV